MKTYKNTCTKDCTKALRQYTLTAARSHKHSLFKSLLNSLKFRQDFNTTEGGRHVKSSSQVARHSLLAHISLVKCQCIVILQNVTTKMQLNCFTLDNWVEKLFDSRRQKRDKCSLLFWTISVLGVFFGNVKRILIFDTSQYMFYVSI